jgi:hypothetical protein
VCQAWLHRQCIQALIYTCCRLDFLPRALNSIMCGHDAETAVATLERTPQTQVCACVSVCVSKYVQKDFCVNAQMWIACMHFKIHIQANRACTHRFSLLRKCRKLLAGTHTCAYWHLCILACVHTCIHTHEDERGHKCAQQALAGSSSNKFPDPNLRFTFSLLVEGAPSAQVKVCHCIVAVYA